MRGWVDPFLWASYTDGRLTLSQNTFEEDLPRLSVTILTGRVQIAPG
jgi:hypothetical protein